MKNLLGRTLVILLFTTTVISCKKGGNKELEEIKEVPLLLTKMTDWNPSTGQEKLLFEFVYNTKNVLTNVKSLTKSYSLEYDSEGKLATVFELHISSGSSTTYTLVYNSAKQVTRVSSQWSLSSSPQHIDYDYNSAGKIIRSNILGGSTVYEYTWEDDNIKELVTMYGDTYHRKLETSNVARSTYHTALNPFRMNAPFLDFIIFNSPSSKNIPKTMENGSMFNRTMFDADVSPVFTTNSQGNVTSLTINGRLSNSWQRIWGNSDYVVQTKFYYNK